MLKGIHHLNSLSLSRFSLIISLTDKANELLLEDSARVEKKGEVSSSLWHL